MHQHLVPPDDVAEGTDIVDGAVEDGVRRHLDAARASATRCSRSASTTTSAPSARRSTSGSRTSSSTCSRRSTTSTIFDQNVVSYLELLQLPYTGCNPRGLLLARDKALSKKLLAYHRIPVPEFEVFRVGRKVARAASGCSSR